VKENEEKNLKLIQDLETRAYTIEKQNQASNAEKQILQQTLQNT